MAKSMNGWDSIPKYGDKRLKTFPHITGVVLAGDVYTVLDHLCKQFAAKVERIKKEQSWGYRAPDKGYSTRWNHTSGTAIDLNSADHPEGKRTYSAGKRAAIEAMLKPYGNVIRWGGHYKGNDVDEMHFEINASASAVKALAAKLKGAPAPKPTPATRTYKVQKGDTLWDIGQKFGIAWQSIYAANKSAIGKDPALIRPGLTLTIPAR